MMATNTLHATYENPTLREVHHSKIFAHYAKVGYDYPTMHLPFTFSGLIGLRTRIYQTVHEGALAFLVVVSSADKTAETRVKKSANDELNLKSLRIDMAEVAGSNPAEPINLFNRKTQERVSSASNELSTLSINSRQLFAARDSDNNGATLSNLVLTFTRGELCNYVDARIIGLADRSCDWIVLVIVPPYASCALIHAVTALVSPQGKT